ncbi:oxidoreductase, partial [Aureobasidium melanogenum]
MPLYRPDNVDTPVLSQFSLKEKVAAVTGGARGIGLEVVRGLAEAGASVALIYTTSSSAQETAAKVAKETGSQVFAYKADVTDKKEITDTINQIAKDFGKLDVPGLEYSEDQWRDIMSVNLDGAMYTAQAAGKIFEKQGGSNSMIFTASVSAILVNIPQKQAAYNASKAALVHLAKSLAVEWTDFARVNCISPGFVETDILSIHPEEWRKKWFDMIPGARMAKAAELESVIILRLYFDE